MQITKLFKKTEDPAIESLIDPDYIKSITPDDLTYTDMYLTRELFIKTMVVGSKGIFIFVPVKKMDAASKIAGEIRRYFSLTPANTFFFFVTETSASLLDKSGKLIELPDMYDAFEAIYRNLSLPHLVQVRLNIDISDVHDLMSDHPLEDENKGLQDDQYVRFMVDTSTVERLCDRCDDLEGNERPEEDRYRDDDGTEYVLRYSPKKVGGIDLGIVGEKKWYRVSEEDTGKLLLSAAFGGCVGLHKFMQGQIQEGLIYLLTGGCLGILPAVDIAMMMSGNYTYDEVSYCEQGSVLKRDCEKVYMRRYQNLMYGCVAVLIALVIGFIFANTLYLGALKMITGIFATQGSNMTPEQASAMVSNIDFFSSIPIFNFLR